MPKRFLLLATLGAALLYRNRASLKQAYANVRAFDLPSAGMYDALVASLLGGFNPSRAHPMLTGTSSNPSVRARWNLDRGVNDTTAARFWEVDAARGIAIIMVILYHLVYDLDNLAGYGVKSTSGFWAAFADVSAFAFVFLAGLSLAISYARASAVPRPGRQLFGKYLRRGLRIFSYGMLITLVFWALGFGTVIFGILHLIGASIVLAYPFMKLRLPNLFLGLSVITVGAYMRIEDVSAGVWLAPLGVVPEGLFMPDYRPLLPWFGVVLLGLFFGNVVYGDRRRKRTPGTEGPAYAAPVAFLGRHTLLIYLIHQPILVATLWALGIINPGF